MMWKPSVNAIWLRAASRSEANVSIVGPRDGRRGFPLAVARIQCPSLLIKADLKAALIIPTG